MKSWKTLEEMARGRKGIRAVGGGGQKMKAEQNRRECENGVIGKRSRHFQICSTRKAV